MYGQGIAGAPVEGFPELTTPRDIYLRQQRRKPRGIRKNLKAGKAELWDWHVKQEIARMLSPMLDHRILKELLMNLPVLIGKIDLAED